MEASKTGQIVWHDLFTSNRDRAMTFYKHVAGWTYRVERATEFAWGGGEKDFVLALLGDEAGAGFAETPAHQTSGWIAYVEVPDVDVAVEQAKKLGGGIVRHPFEVPGVGRNALLRDPLGALFGVCLSRHGFPVPRRQFGPEIYLSNEADFPETFYARVLGWQVSPPQKPDQRGMAIIGPSGDTVALQQPDGRPAGSPAAWLPGIRVTSPDNARCAAEVDGARYMEKNVTGITEGRPVILCDPDGALFLPSKARTNPA